MMGRLFLVVAVVAFLGWTAFTAMSQVQSGQRAVIRRFGRISEQKPEPGLYIGWPWGIEQVDLVPINQVRKIVVGFSDKDEKQDDVVPIGQMLTGDHNLVNVQAEVFFKVRDADVEKFVLHKDNVEAFVARAAESILAEWIAGRKVDDVLRLGKIELPNYLRDQLQDRLHGDLGIVVEQTSINLSPPSEVKEAFERVAQASTNIRTRENEAHQRATKAISEAESQKFNIERQAQQYANGERIRAQAEAESFHKRLEQYRALSRTDADYLNVMWLDDMTRLFARMKETGRIEPLDHFLTSDGLSITQFPLQSKKK